MGVLIPPSITVINDSNWDEDGTTLTPENPALNVGIGTVSTSSKFEVVGSVTFSDGDYITKFTSAVGSISFDDGAGNTSVLSIVHNDILIEDFNSTGDNVKIELDALGNYVRSIATSGITGNVGSVDVQNSGVLTIHEYDSVQKITSCAITDDLASLSYTDIPNNITNSNRVQPDGHLIFIQDGTTEAKALFSDFTNGVGIASGATLPTLSKFFGIRPGATGQFFIQGLPAYDDDTAAGGAGLATGDLYQTTGAGAAPLNVAGIMMVKQ